jgi:hypothetical protein
MSDLLDGLLLAGVISEDLIEDVVDLGGGQPNLGVDYQAIRDNEVARVNVIKWDAMVNEYVRPVLDDGTSSDDDIEAAISELRNAWGN